MTWQYLAGFTDGDGCIGVETHKERYLAVRLRWAQKLECSEVLERIADFLIMQGLKVSSRNFSVSSQGHKYPQCELAITNTEDTRKALTEMLPWLVVKREKAIQALSTLNAVATLKAKYGNKYRVALRKESANG